MAMNMATNQEVQKRIGVLKNQLENDIYHNDTFGLKNHRAALIFMSIALLSSVVAGIGGLAEFFSAKVTGTIALLPSLLAGIVITLKFENKSGWYFRKRNRLQNLKDQLELQLPASPTLDQIAALSKKRNACIEEMQKEWERDLTFNWSGMQKKPQIDSSDN